jgi:hypothetical protein
MKVHNCRNAEVPESKIVDYLLSPGHPEGGPNARFFFKWGFKRDYRLSSILEEGND